MEIVGLGITGPGIPMHKQCNTKSRDSIVTEYVAEHLEQIYK